MKLLSSLSTIRRRWSTERGAVLVEAALAVPLLLFVILGAIEAGMAWEAKSATTSGVRTGLLRAASIGDQPETDLRILQSIIGEIGADNIDGLEWVVIFDATDPDHAATVESCRLAEAGGGIFDTCNTYGAGTQFADIVAGTITQADFDDGGNVTGNTYTCDTSKTDYNWCAPSRLVDGDVQVGVALKYQHDWFTGLFPGDGVDFEDYATSSTFVGEGSEISPSSGGYTPPTSTVYDSGGFDGPLNVGDVTWTGANVTNPPADSSENFLGLYALSDSVGLNITNLDPHTEVCVTFDLLVIGNWEYAPDVNNPAGAEDVFSVGVGSDERKSSYGEGSTNNLGYSGDLSNDYTVTITECFPHTGGDVQIDFSSIMSAGTSNEAWGIDNVVVTLG